MKRKTYKELEKERLFWRILAIGFFIFFMVVGIIVIAFQNQIVELKQQIQQEKVPEIDKMQRVCCYYFDKIQVCWNTELYFNKEVPKNCEVLE